MTIAEAAAAVLRDADGPMHVRNIYAQIANRMLFEFKAKDPIAVVSTVLRKGAQFEKTAPGTFELLDSHLEIVPLDCNYIPSDDAVSDALKKLGAETSKGEECGSWSHDYVQVIGLFDSEGQEMTCPSCGLKEVLDYSAVSALSEMLYADPADRLELTMVCCGSVAMASSVDFGDSLKFARFGITVTPRSSKLGNTTLRELGEILGCPVTQILHIHE